jgi:hypothetical protein
MKRKIVDRKLARGLKKSFSPEKRARMAQQAEMNRTEDKISSARLSLVSNYSLGYMSYELTGMDSYLSLS